jgi:6-oxo-cyclohex-1-ene-carbonyl-CoA hydrolase
VKNHNLTETFTPQEILYERRPVLDRGGKEVEGLHNIWITLNNPKELNAYTTEMVKEIILALREASNDRAALAVILTGAGTRAFCTGGNTREYAEVYAGAPAEYRQYMRLFNDMVTTLLHCDKPVICRVNGMRVGGGQELGMACDFSIASDLALFSQAGPKHGSAPDGGSTDFLPLFVGMEAALYSGTLCEPWSAHRFYYLGGLTQIVPVLKVDGELVANPLVVTERLLDDYGRVVLGDFKKGEERQRGRELLSQGEIDLALLDQTIDAMSTKLLYTMPDCLTKTIESLRKHKLGHWDKNRETNRAWLSLNMMTEANAGFRAFHHGTKKEREVDFVLLRQRLAEGARWGEELVQEIAPWVPRAGESE